MDLESRRPAWPTIVAALALVVLAAALALAGWLALRENSALRGATTGTLRVAVSTPLNTLDPALARTPAERTVGAMAFESIVAPAADGTLVPEPQLAETLPQPSTDGLLWTIVCRRDVTFHDGQPFSCRDVQTRLEALRSNPDALLDSDVEPSTLLALLSRIVSVELVDDYTLNVRLRSPFAFFNEALMHPAAAIARGEVGTGPFQIERWDEDGARLAAFDDHWDGPPELESVIMQVIPDEAARLDSLGQSFDVIDAPPPTADYDVESRVLIGGPGAEVIFIAVNRNVPPLDNPQIQQALRTGIDVPAVSQQTYANHAQPAPLFTNPAMPGYEALTVPATDLRRARETQATAGLPDGYDADVHVDPRLTNWAGLAETLRFQLGDLYIEGTVERLDVSLAEAFAGDEPLALVVSDRTPLDAYAALHWLAESPPPQGDNWLYYENTNFRAWMEQATAALSLEARQAAIEEAREELEADPPVVYLVAPDVLAATTGEVSNLRVSPFGWLVVTRETLILRR